MLQLVTRRVTFRICGMGIGKSRVGDFERQDVGRRSSRAAEKPLRFSPPDLPPFLSKLLGKTSKLQIFPSKLRVFPSKLRRNGQKRHLIFRRLQSQKTDLFPTPLQGTKKPKPHGALSCELCGFGICIGCTLRAYALTRFTYEPSRVSTSIISPSLMNKGTRTSAPVSTVAGLVVLVAVSPFKPGSV